MEKFDLENLIEELLANKRISDVVNNLSLSKEQLHEALPIMIDMSEEEEDGKREYFTSIGINSLGHIQRIKVYSKLGEETAYLENIVSNDITRINFEDDKKFMKTSERISIVNHFGKILEGKEEKGLFVYGPMGVGKTFMFKRFAKKFAQQGKRVGFLNITDLQSKYMNTFSSEESNKATHNFKETYKKVDVLFIDDIGAETIYSWFREGFLFDVLNERMENKLLTFFTSNYPIKELIKIEAKTEKKYKDDVKSARLIERIRALTKEFKLDGKNKRY